MKGDATTHTTNAAYREGWERVFAVRAIPADRDLNTVTAAEWRAASTIERHDFLGRERRRGYVSFVCPGCGFPTACGSALCKACQDIVLDA